VRKALVFGNTGFIGRALQVHLQNGERWAVQGFSSRSLDLRQASALQGLGDVIDPESVVIFASAITREKGDTLGTLIDNISMAGHLGAFLEVHPPAKCVCISSDAVYPMQDAPITEETPVSPGATFYAIAKYAAECILRRSAEGGNFSLLVLRPTGIFGLGDTHNSYGPNAFLRSVVKDRSVRLFGQGEERRDHLFIGDLVGIVDRLIECDTVGVINLATGISRSFADVVESLRRVVPYEFTISYSPRKSPVTHRSFDVSRLLSLLPGFRFTDLEEAMRQTFVHLSASFGA